MKLQEMVAELSARTLFMTPRGATVPQVPAESTFHTLPVDLKIIQPYGAWDYNGPQHIEVRHRHCNGIIDFDPDEQDPIMGRYWCRDGCPPDTFMFCDRAWYVHEMQKLGVQEIQREFYTVLKEAPEDLHDWPEKLTEVVERNVRYTKLRPVTTLELIESRCRRLIAIRGGK